MSNKKPKLIKHLKIIEGQVRGLQKMIDNDTYCVDIITQTSAIKQGLSNIENVLLESHISHCVVNQMKKGQTDKATELARTVLATSFLLLRVRFYLYFRCLAKNFDCFFSSWHAGIFYLSA